MTVAVFDFDGTLAYSSTLIWTRGIAWYKRLILFLMFPISKFCCKGLFQRKAFEFLVGTRITRHLESIKRLPPIKVGVDKLEELQSKGYRVIVMSFSPATVIQTWLDAHGIEADVICPEIEIKDGKVVKISDDEFTQLYLQEPIHAKAKILEKIKLKPNISVGDSHRDILGEKHYHISELGKAPSHVAQLLTTARIH